MSCPDNNRYCDGSDLLHGAWCLDPHSVKAPSNVIQFPTPIVNRDPGDESDYPDAA